MPELRSGAVKEQSADVGPVTNVIIIGPPGAGKGTQAERIARERGVPKISTGDMLRDAVQRGTELGQRAKTVVERGDLVGDEIMIGVVRERLSRSDVNRGFVLDGFPRTVPQARSLDQLLVGREPLIVLEVVVPQAELIRRMTARRICRACGANAGPDDEQCSQCGGELVLRSDDGKAAVRKRRLDVYAKQTEPIITYYRKRASLRSVDGGQLPDQVAHVLAAAIDSVLAAAGWPGDSR